MVKYFFSILLLSSCIYFTLFAKPVSEPSWLLNKESVFPSEEYIAFLGEGKSKTTAKNDAISQLCSYLNTNIEISVLLNSKAESKNKKTDFSQQLEENISLYSSASIRGLEFTEIYQNKKEKSSFNQ